MPFSEQIRLLVVGGLLALFSTILSSFLTTIVTNRLQTAQRKAERAYQDAERKAEHQRWEAAFYLPRQIDTLSNLCAALVDLYNALRSSNIKLPPALSEQIDARTSAEVEKLNEADRERLKIAFERQPEEIPPHLRMHAAISETLPDVKARLSATLYRDAIFSSEENMHTVRKHIHTAYATYERCRALAYAYLTPATLDALERVNQTVLNMTMSFYIDLYSPEDLARIREATDWNAIEEPYNEALNLLKTQLNPQAYHNSHNS